MKLVLDGMIPLELIEYLKTQEEITDASISNVDYETELNIQYNKDTNPIIILGYIDLFLDNHYSELLSFDKMDKDKFKTMKYVIDDMCCDYCYKGLVKDLFLCNYIKSVRSNFDFNKPKHNIDFLIEYCEPFKERDIIDYIKEKYINAE